MILPAIFLAFATACTPDGHDREQPEPTSCESGFILDGSSCVPESCGTGQWGNLPVDDDTIYVDVTAEDGGDGTEETPYATIQRGLNRAGAQGGGLVAVAAGTYPETLEFTTDHADVHLAGRCRDMAILDASMGDGETPGIGIDAGYAEIEVAGVTVMDSASTGFEVVAGVVVMRDLAIMGSRYLGFLAQHPGLSGTSDVSLESCLIGGNVTAGVIIGNSGTQVFLRDTTIRDTQQDANGEYGRGIEVYDGATLSADGCLIEGNTDISVVASNPLTLVTLRNTTVKDTRPDVNGEFGWGIQVQTGATLSAEGCLIEGNTDVGMLATDPGTQVTFRNTLARETHPDGNGQYGRGIEVYDDATFVAEACLIEGNTDVGLLVSNPGTQVTLWNTTVKDTHPDGGGEYGMGISVEDGATLSAEGCLIGGNTEVGLFAGDPGTEVIISDSTISGTKPATDLMASAASGVTVQDGAFLFASHLVVAANQGPGLLVNGHGADGAWIECVGCTIEGNQFAGAITLAGGTLTISDSTIEGTAPSTNLLGGAGVYAWPWVGDPPTVTLTNTLIRDNPIAGVWLIGDGTYVLTDNTISGGIGEPFGSGSRCGDAVLARDGVRAWDGSTGLLLQNNEIQDASGAGIFLDDSSALVSGNAYSGNALDLVVQNQSCSSVPDYYSEAPQRDLCPVFDYPTCYAEFFFVALPSDPVEEGAAPRPQFLPLNPVASPARPSRPIIPGARPDHPSHHPSLSR